MDHWSVDAGRFFQSLSPAEQDKKFTKAGAQAIRDGADIAQVVNARRGAGLSFASGRITREEALAIRRGRARGKVGPVTNEGTTRRGLARRAMQTYGKPPPRQRLMPESIYQAAGEDRDETLRLLKLYGYLFE